MPIHHHFLKGQKIIVLLKDNNVVIDKYVETKGKFLITQNFKIKWEDIQFSSIYKNKEK